MEVAPGVTGGGDGSSVVSGVLVTVSSEEGVWLGRNTGLGVGVNGGVWLASGDGG